jgi:hypothetical protein
LLLLLGGTVKRVHIMSVQDCTCHDVCLELSLQYEEKRLHIGRGMCHNVCIELSMQYEPKSPHIGRGMCHNVCIELSMQYEPKRLHIGRGMCYDVCIELSLQYETTRYHNFHDVMKRTALHTNHMKCSSNPKVSETRCVPKHAV